MSDDSDSRFRARFAITLHGIGMVIPNDCGTAFTVDALSIDGQDRRALPRIKRKSRLARIMPRIESRLLYLDHLASRGCDLFRVACAVARLCHSSTRG